jgi:anti-sigma B factor antagonist
MLRDSNEDNFLWCRAGVCRNFEEPARHVCSAGALGVEMIKRDNSTADQIKHEKIGHIDVLRLSGQFIGGRETDSLRTALQSISEQKSNHLIVHLGAVSYLNSTSLGVLISAHANFVKRNGRIALAEIGDSIRSVFAITKLDNVFEVFPSEEEAIKSFTHL